MPPAGRSRSTHTAPSTPTALRACTLTDEDERGC